MDKLVKRSDLVGEIAGFTSLRDVDLLELSLLKSVFGIVNPKQVSLISMGDNMVLKQVDYSASKHGTIASKIVASEVLIAACDKLDKVNLEYCSVNTQDGTNFYLFFLSSNKKVVQYVAIEIVDFAISKAHAQEVIGMLKIYRNFRQLLQESQTDELTGLSNRKAFDYVVRKILELTPSTNEAKGESPHEAQVKHKYWLALADIDHFKRINDTLGHLMGDEVLVRVAQSIQSEISDSDFVFRYGGEEFALIISASDKETASLLLENVRLSVTKIQIPNLGNISISLGCIEMKNDIFYLSLIDGADKSLYQSKMNGRNQVTFFNENLGGSEQGHSSDVELF